LLQRIAVRLQSSHNGEDEDWRDFRAKLVLQEKRQQVGDDTASKATQESDSASDTSWAYDSGTVIEKGSVILSRSEQDFGYGLRQQYFHKSVILVLHHSEEFTKGVILNRPMDLKLSEADFVNEDGTPLDDTNSDENRWQVWYGGEVQSFYSEQPEIICIHSITSPEANRVSEKIIKDIQWTTLAGACKLVRDDNYRPEDFHVIIGNAGWGPGQLMQELDRKSWFMAATDSETLLRELRKEKHDPHDAGVETWTRLMEKIGKTSETASPAEHFDDLMLREWAREYLVVADKLKQSMDETLEKMLMHAEPVLRMGEIRVGKMLRASAGRHSPFLLHDQEFHQSLVLLIQDDKNISVGVMLNLPSTQSVDFDALRDDDTSTVTNSLPVRYGGRYGVKGQSEKPFIWLHCSDDLRSARVGSALGFDSDHPIWSCTREDAETAVRMGLALPSDFMVISGFSVWPKSEGKFGGIMEDILEGKFEPVQMNKIQDAWDTLINEQRALTADNVEEMLSVANSAWLALQSDGQSFTSEERSKDVEADAAMVFESDTTVEELADAALRAWVATFLLKQPGLRKV